MKSLRSTAAGMAAMLILILAASAIAIAGPFDMTPAGFRLGGVYIVTAASDTLFATISPPPGALALKSFSAKTVQKATSGISGLVTLPPQKADGVIFAAKKPFRYRAFIAGGMGTGTTYVPVDTTSSTANKKYPCRGGMIASVDSIRMKPATSDTIWVAFLLRD